MNDDLICESDIRGTIKKGLTVELAWNIGKALADWLPAPGPVLVTYNQEQEKYAKAVIEGIRLQGRDVVDGANFSWEEIAARGVSSEFAGSVVTSYKSDEQMVTLALYQAGAMLITSKTGLKEICELVKAGNFMPAATKGNLTVIAT